MRVLLDITMDDMDGWETARRIRAAGQTALPIVVGSANAFENLAAVPGAGSVGDRQVWGHPAQTGPLWCERLVRHS